MKAYAIPYHPKVKDYWAIFASERNAKDWLEKWGYDREIVPVYVSVRLVPLGSNKTKKKGKRGEN